MLGWWIANNGHFEGFPSEWNDLMLRRAISEDIEKSSEEWMMGDNPKNL